MNGVVKEFVNPRKEAWDEGAAYMRDLADRMERGEISECAIVINDRAENAYATFGHFDDRWRLMGALEYAKSRVLFEGGTDNG